MIELKINGSLVNLSELVKAVNKVVTGCPWTKSCYIKHGIYVYTASTNIGKNTSFLYLPTISQVIWSQCAKPTILVFVDNKSCHTKQLSSVTIFDWNKFPLQSNLTKIVIFFIFKRKITDFISLAYSNYFAKKAKIVC